MISEKARNAASVSATRPTHRNTRPMPSRPSEATERPITPPPKNAIRSAGPWPWVRAASDVRTFASVAALIPKNPARIEHRAPAT